MSRFPMWPFRIKLDNPNSEVDEIGQIMGDVFADFGLVGDVFSVFLFPFAGGRYQLPLMPSRDALLVAGWLKVPIRTDLLPDGVFLSHLTDERLLTALRSALGRNVEVYQVPKNPAASIFSEVAEAKYTKDFDVWYFIELNRDSLRSVPRLVPPSSVSPAGFVLPLPVGQVVGGKMMFLDWPNQITGLLLGGATNTGKSVFLRQAFLFYYLNYSPSYHQMWVCDFKHGLEFSSLPLSHFRVFTSLDEGCVDNFLKSVSDEALSRFSILRSAGCVNILDYNQKFPQAALPFITIWIDEFASFRYLGGKDVLEEVSLRAAQTRAAGMFWCVGTQRPDVSIVIGSLKANLGTRITFSQATKIDYNVICGEGVLPEYVKGSLGCPGRGWCVCGDRLFEFQSPFVSPDVFSSHFDKVG